jgi:uncharacterized protein
MKALIISDSHRWTNELQEIIVRHRNEVDLIIHCGDSELAESAKEIEGIHIVKGNCDRANFPEELIIEKNDKKFYITHGHHYNVKNSLMSLKYRSEELGANIVCFGHSHVLTCEKDDETLYINPGSIKSPRFITVGTYAIYEHVNGKEKVNFYDTTGSTVKTYNISN